MAAEQSERIKLWGIVQGVGFRPYVAKIAETFGMKGHVLNIGGLVEIVVTDTPERISAFLNSLIENKPEPSEIVHVKREVIEYTTFDSFTIVKSDDGGDETAMIPSDLAICPQCLKELYSKDNPRFQHPFISCMACGPRYTIIDRIPYDRHNTSMVDFPMCSFCEGEYTDLHDRRYHAQTISCHSCGPELLWKSAPVRRQAAEETSDAFLAGSASGDKCIEAGSRLCSNADDKRNDTALEADSALCTEDTADEKNYAAFESDSRLCTDKNILDHAADALSRGAVLLFKSVGGYNLIADPFSDEAVSKLRRIKAREEKPFAVMFRSIDEIKQFCHIDQVEERLLSSSARPILLLEHRLEELCKTRSAGDTSTGNASAGGTSAGNTSADNTLAGNTPDDSNSFYYAANGSSAGGNINRSFSAGSPAELKRSRFIGSFLPSFAAQYMLLDRISPLIFTSANLSDMPMIRDDDEALKMLESNSEIDGMIYNLRHIRVRADDSVARIIDGQPQMIRRSKGYAPVPLFVNTDDADSDSKESGSPKSDSTMSYSSDSGSNRPDASRRIPHIFAAGSQLKNSFALTKGNFVYMSQFFGDMDTMENQEIYRENLVRLSNLFRIKPEAVVCDMHPGYFTTGFSEEYARSNDLPLIKVQHHHAHVASVMAENDIKGKVIGVSFDGTGYGLDSNIWGGEFFLCQGGDAERIAHLRYVDMIGGDSSVRDAARSALSYIHAYDNLTAESPADCTSITIYLDDIISFGRRRLLSKPSAPLVMSALKAGVNTVKSSSMGRLFDAVSALLGIKDSNDYEGQCAIMLEDAAAFAQRYPGKSESCDLALSFHERIIDMIVGQCCIARNKYGADQVALTGGTFQNRILMEGVLQKLRDDGFTPYYNISVSPNDGGIALGQAYVAMHRLAAD